MIWNGIQFYVKNQDLNSIGHKVRWKVSKVLDDLGIVPIFKTFNLKTKGGVHPCKCLLLSDTLSFMWASYNGNTEWYDLPDFFTALHEFSVYINLQTCESRNVMDILKNLSVEDKKAYFIQEMKSNNIFKMLLQNRVMVHNFFCIEKSTLTFCLQFIFL